MLLHEQLKSYNLILASLSPRRKELLERLDLEFTVSKPYNVEEIPLSYLAYNDIPEDISMTKSMGYPFPLADNDILITADTLVFMDGEIVGKPVPGHAEDPLKFLAGRDHEVITGVVLRTNRKTISFSDSTIVSCEALDQEELDYYIEKYKPYDKAGAYGIQDWIGCAGVRSITGSYYNVMGLPLHKVYKELKNIIK
ncbi:MAG: Maf family protein [Rikenellaceae bacterium]